MIMNNKLNVFYDSKTTEWLEKHGKILNDYETILLNKLKTMTNLTNADRVRMYDEDMVRNQIIKLISDFLRVSIPVGFEIVDLDKE
jgi:CRP-like cAMP-binding protein